MDEYEFEELVADVWEAQGYETTVTSGSSDRGIDVIAEKDGLVGEKVLIQAKRYGEGNKVGSREIREYGSLRRQEENVDAVIVVTTSSFTREAENTAEDLNVKLVDGESLTDSMSPEEMENIGDDYNLIEKSNADSSGRMKTQKRIECPYCNTIVADEKEAMFQHWKGSSECGSSTTSYPWLNYTKKQQKVPCTYCGNEVLNTLSAFSSHWLSSNSCNLPQDMSAREIVEDAKIKSTERDLISNKRERDGFEGLTSNSKNNNGQKDISEYNENHTNNLSPSYDPDLFKLTHPKISSDIQKDKILNYFTNSKHGVGINGKNNKITPYSSNKTVIINTKNRVVCIVGKNNKDIVIDLDKQNIKHSEYHTGITKSRIEIRLKKSLSVEDTDGRANQIHIWVTGDKSDLDFLSE